MDTFECEALVIGGGAVGLAVGRQLALAGLDTVILEKNRQIGMETSSRHSEVIHAGIYYPKDSLKATMCVRGRDLLYTFCENHGVGCQRLGKLIVATNADQNVQLATIAKLAMDNGVHDLTPLSKAKISLIEPALFVTEGLFSPSTGIVDSHQYMLALLGDAESAGASLIKRAKAIAIDRIGQSYRLTIENNGESFGILTRILINSAGLWAQTVAEKINGLNQRFIPPLHLAKGSYATLLVKSPFRHLVYPVPEPGALGIHLTLDLGGQARFGPNIQWLETNDPALIDYTVSQSLPRELLPHVTAYWPAITEGMLAPGYSGVRPKIAGIDSPPQDFRIDGPDVHGMCGLVNLFGIESPGLTSSLAIAEYVISLLNE